jgi:hypothetical protein
MKYQGFFKHVNDEPTGDYINIFVSDWNKEHFAFYVYIDKDNYEEDIDNINELITKLNYRDQDIYIELIDRTEDLKHFYSWVYDKGTYAHWDILNKELWELLEEKEDFHFLAFSKIIGSYEIEELKDFEYSSFNDWYEVLETYHPDLYKCLDESNGLGCFDIEHFFNCQGFEEIEGLIVSGC